MLGDSWLNTGRTWGGELGLGEIRKDSQRITCVGRVQSTALALESGRALLLVRLLRDKETLGVVAAINMTDHPLSLDDEVRLTGTLSGKANAFGTVLTIEKVSAKAPASVEARRQLMRSVLGIDDIMASTIVTHFGDDLIGVLDRDISRLAEVLALPQGEMAELQEKWSDYRARGLEEELFNVMGLSEPQARRVRTRAKQQGRNAVEALQANPFFAYLYNDDVQIDDAWKLAKRYKQQWGGPLHMQALVVAALRDAAINGHTYLPDDQFTDRIARRLRQADSSRETHFREKVALAVEQACANKYAAREGPQIYIPQIREHEVGLAQRLYELSSSTSDFDLPDHLAAVSVKLGQFGISIEEKPLTRLLKAMSGHCHMLLHDASSSLERSLGLILAIGMLARLKVEILVASRSAYERLSGGAIGAVLRADTELDAHLSLFSSGLGLDGEALAPSGAPDLVVLAQAECLSTEEALKLLGRYPPSTATTLLVDVAMNPPLGAGQPALALHESKLLPSAMLPETDKRPRRPGHAILPLMRNPNQITAYQSTKHRWMAIESEDEKIAGYVSELLTRVFKKLPGVNGVEGVQILTTTLAKDAAAGLTETQLRELFGVAGPTGMIDGVEYMVGDPVYALAPMDEIGMRRGDVATVEAVDADSSQLNLIRGDRIVTVPRHLLSRLRIGYLKPLYAAVAQRFTATILLLPSTVSEHAKHKGTLYSAAAIASEWSFALGNVEWMREALEIDRESKHGLYSAFPTILGDRFASGDVDNG